MEESRVLDGDTVVHVDGDLGSLGEVDGASVSMANGGVDSDGENEVKVEEIGVRGLGDVDVSPEVGGDGVSGAQSEERKDDMGLMVEEDVRWNVVCKDEGSKKEDKDGDFRSENRVSMSKEVSGNDADDEMGAGSLKILDSTFEIGDMVWGKVKSHPWWPGHLFNEAFATSSVRRMRRHGHVLVAFFGDSSYGWFDTTELVPFDLHFAEKAEQTTSRNFVRAVEESVDEASRRSALGLSCCCRNQSNFRPASVPGYVAVDVVDYEAGAVYSLSQIRKARDNFRPFNTLAFIKQLAVAPMSGESKNLDFIKNKATTLAYRRSIFEEYDETYAQAFNQQPMRPPQALHDKQPSRAPLSGPLVVADALGGRNSSIKPTKTKQSKKDRYLFKRRDMAGDLSTTLTAQGHANPSSSSAYEERTSDAAAAAYLIQKRDSDVSNDELGGASCTKDKLETSDHAGPTKDASITGIDAMAPSVSQVVSAPVLAADMGNLHDKAPEGHLEIRDGMKNKKKKVHKRPVVEQSFEKSDRPVKKMKKVKRKDGRSSIGHGEKDSVLSGMAVKSARMPIEIGDPFTEDSQVSQCRKENETTNPEPSQMGVASLGIGGNEADLPQVLADLRSLALNPVHGTEKNGPVITSQFFLKFRSLVYLKSSGASAPVESEPGEVRAMKSTGSESSEKPAMEGGKVASSSKPQKSSSKHEDLAKGRKRIPSERQEENAAKKAKKITEVKSLSAEKRALLKNPDMQQRPEAKPKTAAAQNSPSKSTFKLEQREKKMDRPPKVEEPTYLIMKFQPGSALPSLVELKARFARFGPLDVKLSRVFYTTNTCRVAFLYKQHANVAYNHAMGNKSVFSNVKFLLKPVASPEAQQANSGKVEDVQSESAVNRDSPAPEARRVDPTLTTQQSAPQLKSCLKKTSGGDETGGSNARTARVRFNMIEVKGGSTDNRGGLQGPKMESRNSMLSPNEGPSSSPSSSVAIDISNNQRFPVSSHPLQPPLLPLPPQFVRAPVNHQFHHRMVELTIRNNLHDNNPKIIPPLALPENQAPPTVPAVPALPTKDISQQMMSLLTRCHDVVTNVTSILGYVPYHPL